MSNKVKNLNNDINFRDILQEEIKLRQAFWLLGIGFLDLLGLPFDFVEEIFLSLHVDPIKMLLAWGYLITYILIYLTVLTIIWRSANKYQGFKIWKQLAKAIVGIRGFLTVGTFLLLIVNQFMPEYSAVETKTEIPFESG